MLITFLVFALLALLLLLTLLWYFIPSSRVATSVPGLRPADQVWGNLPNISDAGGLPHFLQIVHRDHGSIASFWLGDFLAISVGSHHLFKIVDNCCPTNGLPYQTIVPLTLDKDMLEQTSPTNSFLNSIISSFSPFNHRTDPSLGSKIRVLAQELCDVLSTVGSEDQVPIDDYVDALAVKVVAETSGLLKNPDTDMSRLRLAFTNLTKEMEAFMEAGKEVGEDKRKILIRRAEEFLQIVGRKAGAKVFGLITVISVLSTWIIYHLARNPSIQKRLRKDDSLIETFLVEVSRVSGFLPFTSRVLAKQDLSLLGHNIEEGTLVINSLSSVGWDRKVFPDPEVVDLQRDKSLPNILHIINPSYTTSYSYCVIINLIKTLLGTFTMELADPEVEVGKKFTIVMKPDSDIWIKLKKL